jgi:hypothetical protein
VTRRTLNSADRQVLALADQYVESSNRHRDAVRWQVFYTLAMTTFFQARRSFGFWKKRR